MPQGGLGGLLRPRFPPHPTPSTSCTPLLLPAESEIKGDVLFLGHYQSAFDWDDETAKVRTGSLPTPL